MYIEEVIVDGFKSYARRTTIGRFDPQFNAITGLNGSGKSNILDSICFVLGIQNLSLVRVTTIQELIYKSGQCGVTKATVTLVFNNSDKSVSPTGYESFDTVNVSRQITVAGKNKYMLNGQMLPQSHILTFFRAIGLNVNNPHFLIMQGKVMEVVDMKPKEILAMIEEVTGTKMYQTKRLEAVKVLDKKDAKLAEIESVLKNEITPAKEKLKRDAESLTNLRTKKAQADAIENNLKIFSYLKNQNTLRSSQKALMTLKTTQQQTIEKLEKLKQKVSEMAEDFVEDKLESYDGEESRLNKVEEEIEILKTRIAGENTHLKTIRNKKEKLKSEIKRVQNETGDDDERILREVEWSEKRLQELKTRLEKINGENLRDDVAEQINTELRESRIQMEDLIRQKQRAIPLEVNVEEMQRTVDEIIKEENVLRERVAQFQKENPSVSAGLSGVNLSEKSAELRDLQHKYDDLVRGHNFEFRYRDPTQNFNRRLVNGFVLNLVVPNDMKYASALEIAAGAKLFHVVCDSDATATLVMQRGGLKKRMTFVPLNKISPQVANPNQIRKAKEIGGDKIYYAMDVVGYPEGLEMVAKYVFGNVLIAEDEETARKVCFHPQVMMKTVTILGDLYDPSGVLTGGCKPKASGFISEVSKQRDVLKQIEIVRRDVDQLRGITDKLDEREREEEQLQIVIARRKAAEKERERVEAQKEEREQAIKEREIVERKISEKENEMRELIKRRDEVFKERKRLENGEKETVKKEIIKKIKTEESVLNAKMQEKQKAEEKMKKLEIEKMKVEEWSKEVENQTNSEREVEKGIAQIESQKNDKLREAEDVRKLIGTIKERNLQTTRKVNEKSEKKKKINREINELEMANKRLEKDVSEKEGDVERMSEEIERIEKKNAWIKRESTNFDISRITAKEISDAKQQLEQMRKEEFEIEKGVNKQIVFHQDKVEKEFKELISRKHIIETDKDKIVKVIKDLDDKMQEAIQTAFNFVNEKVGEIFGTLHPGASARLVPTDGNSIYKGIEPQVRLGELWKESLMELSGGQKSLLALSLILAILVYKPSPLYILDEVDAALDVSNTQNFGAMLKKHFKTSQFIVVSLKSGMFDNANVLFNTKVINNISSVVRTVGKKPTRHTRDDE
ncbi:nucleoporin nup211, putative [Entamoeba invadens IP1]|uniref:Nucleoporin nup211, putative n=1 Tax=Entamoeba invadens IP1 TaxID=370355 RepID=A0A0A1UFU1_ENTIV|nr:nucleoporin nup211, putative [Entamoeba invadens IP1]ELP91919.1 nucleoporin nup211, putative [Entamoeba invadens IP1]|eukprot:XP_004258690.1 nucleoporin nup211, putative [Entamoeba invadens IP1]